MAKPDDYINPCCFCEPLAQWLEERLSAALPTMASDIRRISGGSSICGRRVKPMWSWSWHIPSWHTKTKRAMSSASISGAGLQAFCVASRLGRHWHQICRPAGTWLPTPSTLRCMRKPISGNRVVAWGFLGWRI